MKRRPAFDSRDRSVVLTLDLRAYRLAAIKKTAYRLAERFTVVIAAPDPERIQVKLLMKPGTTDDVADRNVRAFYEELLDQELREHVAEETAPIRTLILAHAFSRTGLIRHQ
jgi:His-Xaa-Ser system protein HxsD